MRLALLTGGSKGLGFALCGVLAEQEFRILEFSRSAPHAYSVRTDLSSPEGSLQAVAGALAGLGNEPVEELLVINNAGTIDPVGPASRKPHHALVANLNTNFTSAILILTEIIKHFQAVPCRKVLANISSGAAQQAYSGWSLYCATKAGLEHFVRTVALEQQAELHPFIPINIDPGLMDTEMQARHLHTSSESDFPALPQFLQWKEQGILAQPEKVAAAVYRILGLPSLSYGARYETRDHDGC